MNSLTNPLFFSQHPHQLPYSPQPQNKPTCASFVVDINVFQTLCGRCMVGSEVSKGGLSTTLNLMAYVHETWVRCSASVILTFLSAIIRTRPDALLSCAEKPTFCSKRFADRLQEARNSLKAGVKSRWDTTGIIRPHRKRCARTEDDGHN